MRTVAAELELVGADVVEVIPSGIGTADASALVAERVVREALTGRMRRCGRSVENPAKEERHARDDGRS